jgi:hypothetical protein
MQTPLVQLQNTENKEIEIRQVGLSRFKNKAAIRQNGHAGFLFSRRIGIQRLSGTEGLVECHRILLWLMMGAGVLEDKLKKGMASRKIGYPEIFSRFGTVYLNLFPKNSED